MRDDLKIALMVIESLENQETQLRVSRGYGAGHPHFGGDSPRPLGNRTGLGSSRYEVNDEDEDTEEGEVKISRAFAENE